MPELVADRPSIPTYLMNEPDSNRAVFFHEVGVSAGSGSGFPGFADLVGNMYETNHMQPDAVEHEALDHEERNSGRRWPNSDSPLGLPKRSERLGIRRHWVGSDPALCGIIRGGRFPAK